MVVWFIFALLSRSSFAQACCTAGTPIAGSLDLTVANANTWQLALSYEYNYLDDVLAGSEKIKGFRSRLSQSMLLNISYGYNDRFSFTALLSYLHQTRILNFSNSTTITSGPGDASMLIKYYILKPDILSQKQWAVGGGLKFPTGKADIKNGSILFSADLQPGSGSWDGLFWTYFSQGFLPLRFSYFLSSSYRLNGANDRYQITDSGPGYQFGNEFLFNLGAAYSTVSLFNLNFQLRYRNTAIDRLGTVSVPNSGGKWLYVMPGLNVNFEPFTIQINSQFPIYRKIKGIQLTTSYKVGVALSYVIDLN